MNGTSAGFLAIALVLGPGVRWLWLMQRVRIPKDRTAYIAPSVAGALVGVFALSAHPSLAAGISAGLAVVSGSVFALLCAASRQAPNVPAVTVGRPIVDFTALDDEGRPFDLASLRGRPFLLKFFRGHWCPYCVAELRRWNELEPELDAHGIRIVTVCSDSAEQIRKGRTKHRLKANMLPDPDLAITDRYNLRNPKNFAPKPGVVIPLPIPTTILVDASGIVRWIDQSTDYMQRSDPETVRTAIAQTLGTRQASGSASASAALMPA
ncbi:MAG TPA: peroxiredoxin family protein [Candidatus Limnocylindrales bacterium]|nr:peroxiredoxin family protein [Candidatus Limnocylindrales bacterium]